MAFLVFKYLTTAFIIVLVSEVAKRTDRLGALLASLPLVSIMVMIWLFVEKQGTEKVANHAFYTFWFVIPTLPMFLVMPWMLNRGHGFWLSLGVNCGMTIILFFCFAMLVKTFGIRLLP